MERILRINVPEGVDLEHAYQSITDALYLPESVTQAEYDLIERILSDLRDYGSKKIAVIWSADDVHVAAENCEDVQLTEDEAESVLELVEKYHDANEGINWDVLSYHIQNFKQHETN